MGVMANKKQISPFRKNRSRIVFIVYNVSIIVTLFMLTIAVVSQQKVIDSIGKNEFNNLVSDLTSANYSAVNINATEQRAYVPQVTIAFKYVNQLSDVQYRLASSDTDARSDKAQIFFSDKQQLLHGKGVYDASCLDPYVLSINTENPEEYTQVGEVKLSDGRVVIYAASSKQECAGYIQGETGRELLANLLTAQAY